ncbi:MAG TPA: hypothetical protein VGP47_09305, partial [Parachlamydiaceae bacterium]|nr:hypothetical protein [Parachlamydiaceae bacterium]
PQEFDKVKEEIDNSSDHFLRFIISEFDEASGKPILFQEMLGLSDDTLLHIYDLGAVLIEKGNLKDAKVLFTFLTTLAPYVESYWIALGVCFQELKHPEDAILAFGAAKFLKPMDPAPSFYTIESYLLLKEHDKAKLELETLKNTMADLDSKEKEKWEQKVKGLAIS